MAFPVAAAGVMSGASSAISGLGKAIGEVGDAAVKGTLAMVGMAGAIKLANPAVFDQFTLAMKDMMAVVGQALTPLFQQVLIPALRMMGDAFTQLSPAFKAITIAIQPLVSVFGEVFTMAIGVLAEAIKAAAPLIMALGRILTDVMNWIMRQARALLAMLGITLPDVKPGSSVGAAARSASHMGIEEALKQAQRSAFSLGTASNDPMAQTADMAKKIKEQADAIYNFLMGLPQRIWDNVKELPGMIWDFVKELPQMMWDLIKANQYDETKDPNSMYSRSGGVIVNQPQTINRLQQNTDSFGDRISRGWDELTSIPRRLLE